MSTLGCRRRGAHQASTGQRGYALLWEHDVVRRGASYVVCRLFQGTCCGRFGCGQFYPLSIILVAKIRKSNNLDENFFEIFWMGLVFNGILLLSSLGDGKGRIKLCRGMDRFTTEHLRMYHGGTLEVHWRYTDFTIELV